MRIFDKTLNANFPFVGSRTIKEEARPMDETGFEEIYARTARPLRGYVLRMTGNDALADDVLQETFLRFLRAPITDTVKGAIKSYLYKIATNLVYDHFRRAQRESRWQIQTASETPAAASGNFTEETEMMRVLSHLKPQERALLWLAYVEGYEHREIADVLRLRPMSVKVLLFRARRKLALLIKSEAGEVLS